MKPPAVTVTAKCVGCGAKREIMAGEIPANDVPVCTDCGMPMVAVRATWRTRWGHGGLRGVRRLR